MWTREALKTRAKQELKKYYWLAFAVCLVANILGGGISSGVSGGIFPRYNYNYNYNYNYGYNYNYNNHWGPFQSHDFLIILSVLLAVFAVVIPLVICFMIFVGNPVEVGKASFFIQAAGGNTNFVTLFSAFKDGRYMKTVKVMFRRSLYIFLWSLLFLIPGIIKSYAYRMVPYIISEYPDLTPEEALKYSEEMTYGHKGNMFVLDLSFLGWAILGTLACGIGTVFLVPYIEATQAQLYFTLRSQHSEFMQRLSNRQANARPSFTAWQTSNYAQQGGQQPSYPQQPVQMQNQQPSGSPGQPQNQGQQPPGYSAQPQQNVPIQPQPGIQPAPPQMPGAAIPSQAQGNGDIQSASKFCTKCGNQLSSAQDTFCSNCGTKV